MTNNQKPERSQFFLSAILVATLIVSLWLGVIQFFADPPVAGFVPLVVGLACYLFRDPCLFIAAPGLMALVMGFYFHPGSGSVEASPVDWVILGLTCAATVVICSIAWTKRLESRRLASGTQCFVVATAVGSLTGVSIGLAMILWAIVLLVSGELLDGQRVFFILTPLFSILVLMGYLLSIPLGVLSALVCAALPAGDEEGGL